MRGRQSAAMVVVPAEGEPWRRTVDLRVEDHAAPLDELRRLLTLQRAYDLAGAGDELLAAGRTDEAGELYQRGRRARARTRTSCCSGPAWRRAQAGRPRRAAWRRSGERPRRTRTGWSSSTGSHRSSRPAGRSGASRSADHLKVERAAVGAAASRVVPRLTATWFGWPLTAATPGAWRAAEPTGEAVYEHLLTSLA